MAVHATILSADLQTSRGRIVAAREEERRRLRRDLHDGLGRGVHRHRPPDGLRAAPADLGLAGALRRQVDQLQTRSPVVTLHVPQALPQLPAAVEVAAFRITVEALTTAIRHAGAQSVSIRLHVDGALEIAVDDDGAPAASWRPGVA